MKYDIEITLINYGQFGIEMPKNKQTGERISGHWIKIPTNFWTMFRTRTGLAATHFTVFWTLLDRAVTGATDAITVTTGYHLLLPVDARNLPKYINDLAQKNLIRIEKNKEELEEKKSILLRKPPASGGDDGLASPEGVPISVSPSEEPTPKGGDEGTNLLGRDAASCAGGRRAAPIIYSEAFEGLWSGYPIKEAKLPSFKAYKRFIGQDKKAHDQLKELVDHKIKKWEDGGKRHEFWYLRTIITNDWESEYNQMVENRQKQSTNKDGSKRMTEQEENEALIEHSKRLDKEKAERLKVAKNG